MSGCRIEVHTDRTPSRPTYTRNTDSTRGCQAETKGEQVPAGSLSAARAQERGARSATIRNSILGGRGFDWFPAARFSRLHRSGPFARFDCKAVATCRTVRGWQYRRASSPGSAVDHCQGCVVMLSVAQPGGTATFVEAEVSPSRAAARGAGIRQRLVVLVSRRTFLLLSPCQFCNSGFFHISLASHASNQMCTAAPRQLQATVMGCLTFQQLFSAMIAYTTGNERWWQQAASLPCTYLRFCPPAAANGRLPQPA